VQGVYNVLIISHMLFVNVVLILLIPSLQNKILVCLVEVKFPPFIVKAGFTVLVPSHVTLTPVILELWLLSSV